MTHLKVLQTLIMRRLWRGLRRSVTGKKCQLDSEGFFLWS